MYVLLIQMPVDIVTSNFNKIHIRSVAHYAQSAETLMLRTSGGLFGRSNFTKYRFNDEARPERFQIMAVHSLARSEVNLGTTLLMDPFPAA
jgi:hypothetical protein